MPSIRNAYAVSTAMGRVTGSLHCRPSVGLHSNEVHVVTEVVNDGKPDPHNCFLVFPEQAQGHANRLNPASESTRWHCDCADFQYTFYPFLHSNNQNVGVFPEPVINGSGKPRAIGEYGLCKHLMCLYETLVTEGMTLSHESA